MTSKAVKNPKKPLHVRVAIALGCEPRLVQEKHWGKPIQQWHWECTCGDRTHGSDPDDTYPDAVAEYDSDDHASWRLVERYKIMVSYGNAPLETERHPIKRGWWACVPGFGSDLPIDSKRHYRDPQRAVAEAFLIAVRERGPIWKWAKP